MSKVFLSILDRQFVRLLILFSTSSLCFNSSRACNRAQSCSILPRHARDNIWGGDTHANSTGGNLNSTSFLRSETENRLHYWLKKVISLRDEKTPSLVTFKHKAMFRRWHLDSKAENLGMEPSLVRQWPCLRLLPDTLPQSAIWSLVDSRHFSLAIVILRH